MPTARSSRRLLALLAVLAMPAAGGALPGGSPATPPAAARSFAAQPQVSGTLEAPRRLYAGYAALFALESEAPLSGAEVQLQARAGSGWKVVGKEPYHSDRTEIVAKLPAGRRAIRMVVVAGGSSSVVATRTLTVRRSSGRRATSRRDDGRYGARRPAPGSTLRFKVSGGGRALRGFDASVSTFCVGPSLEDNRIFVAFAKLDVARIAPDGSVTAQLKTSRGARLLLTGRVRHRRFTGRVELAFSTCSGSRTLDAARRR